MEPVVIVAAEQLAVPSAAAGTGSAERAVAVASDEEIEAGVHIRFCPPVYLQRYHRVSGILEEQLSNWEDKSPKTILEVGSAECKMFKYLKRLPTVEKIIMMDIDKLILKDNKMLLRPLPFERVCRRETPLVVECYAGCITKLDSRILNCEPSIFAIVAIEVIEHLDPDIGLGFEKTLFYTVAPPLIILTTPNSEYNVAFGLEKGKFRHWDHRFEWTRQDFKNWCDKMCSKYPYTYTIEGIGAGPEDLAHLGHVSQVAIFKKTDNEGPNDTKDKEEHCEDTDHGNCYELVEREEYPFFKDTSPIEERILREFQYFANMILLSPSCRWDYEADGLTEITYPLKRVMDIHKMPKVDDESVIRIALETGGYQTRIDENDETQVIIPIPPEVEDSFSSEEEDENGEQRSNNSFSHLPIGNLEEEDWT